MRLPVDLPRNIHLSEAQIRGQKHPRTASAPDLPFFFYGLGLVPSP